MNSATLLAVEEASKLIGVVAISLMIVGDIWFFVNREKVLRRNWMLRRSRPDYEPGGSATSVQGFVCCVGLFFLLLALVQVIAS